MTEYAQQLVGAAWEVAGRRVAHSLDATHSALVIGEDPIAAASAALGIARVQAARRRVAIADLIGETPPLQELVSDGDPHGVSDSFQFGVSLSRVAHRVDEAGSLFIIPSGAEPVITDDVLRSERWRVLADSYRADGGLLLVVAPPHAPGLSTLARFLGGVVLSGDVDTRTLGDVRVITVVTPPPDARAVPEPLDGRLADAPLAPPPREPRAPRPALPPAPRRTRRAPMAAGAAVAAAAVAWFTLGGESDRDPSPRVLDSAAATADAAPMAPPSRPVDPRDTLSAVASPATTARAAAAGAGPLLVINPGDSARAAHFAVLISTFPSADRARARLQQDAGGVPAATISAAGDGARHQYVAGAFRSRADADALLARLRRQAAVGSRGGAVIDRPLAFLVREGVALDSVPALTQDYRERRVAVYALVQPDGSARLYSGAYGTPAQAAAAAAALRTAGLAPTLAYRTGTPR